MKTSLKVFLLTITIIVFMTTTALAISGYQMDWWTIDSGGGISQSAGSEYTLQGTIGQADASSSHGGEYGLKGGFWASIRGWVTQFFVHLPLVLR